MFKKLKRAQPRPPREPELIGWKGFPHGMHSAVPAFMLKDTEVVDSTNFILRKGGGYRPRGGAKLFTTEPLSAEILEVQGTPVGILAVCADGNIYSISDVGVPTLRATLPGPNVGSILIYNDAVILFDGL